MEKLKYRTLNEAISLLTTFGLLTHSVSPLGFKIIAITSIEPHVLVF